MNEETDIKQEIILYALLCIVCAVLMFGFFYILFTSLKVAEKSECMHWQDLAKTEVGFYVTEWQKEQCDTYGVPVNAPVK